MAKREVFEAEERHAMALEDTAPGRYIARNIGGVTHVYDTSIAARTRAADERVKAGYTPARPRRAD